MKWLYFAVVVILTGCQVSKPGAQVETDGGPSSSSSDVGIVSPAAGGSSPVTNMQSVEGSGSGVGQSMKNKAREVAGQQSAAPPPSEDGN